ncbi:MAG: hypothetical protein A3F84_25035 [Candidatus Handelsmanbacteria bacterium RIFCSPLOWO2_12_FULL_64_10]|uniref:Uncharacterized protein n=1 Tax=Handelsmanbacteria sp. (strain RIFCSPLOWO2_12_FULL_64_10) TaxID=1817868 RepID=A0A1F6CJD8_HANXR|nr:MAG: hypothetical protein A3F84_25035 [Candidatus Handelsmanbacteria bacterium RIFCSPLOWO2_12_FULL_64_10]
MVRAIAPCLLTLLSSRPALACAVCFGSPDSSLTQGAKAGILILLGVVATVLTGIVAVAAFWARRARMLETQGALDQTEGQQAHA